jgi:PadR family transcriptional regulator PadR
MLRPDGGLRTLIERSVGDRLPSPAISSILGRNRKAAVLSLSSVDELVLLAIAGSNGEAYGVSIHDSLRRAGMRASLGAIYASLERLEHHGFVKSALGEVTPNRGGRRKRLFCATPRGKSALAKSHEIRGRLGMLQGQPT